MIMSAQTQHNSAESRSAGEVPGILLDEVTKPGSYVCLGTGDLIRITQADLSPRHVEPTKKPQTDPIYVAQISKDPFIPNSRARIAAADLDIEINF